MHTHFVNSIEDMLEIGKSKKNIGKYVKYNDITYKLIDTEILPGNANIDSKSKKFKVTLSTSYSGILTIWEDNNGFRSFFFDTYENVDKNDYNFNML